MPLDFLQYKFLKNFGENHDQNETIDETNINLLNSIHTQTVDVNKEICVQFYDLEHQVHANNEAEIHWCLHKKMDPSVVENILDSGEPGCTTGCIQGFENLLGRRIITRLRNKITRSPKTKEVIGTIIGIIKIESKYVDLFKDTALTIVMLEAIGNIDSIFNFPTNFSVIIVMLMFTSIFLPLFLSTLHLIVNRGQIIVERNFSKTRKYLTITLCWITSFLNPIILDAYYQELKEDVRKMTQNRDNRAMATVRKCRRVKRQIVIFRKIELG